MNGASVAANACEAARGAARKTAGRAGKPGIRPFIGSSIGPSVRPTLVLLAVATGLVMALLDATIVNIAIPAIMDDFDTGVTTVSWVVNAYNLSLAVLFLAMGRVAQRFGQRRVFVAGLVVFTLFSLACALAPTIEWLIAFRVLQGVGAAAMLPVSLSILLAVFPPERHGAAIGAWAGIGVVAAAFGPTIGGVLTEYAAWQWIFYINLPIGLLAVLLAFRFVPALPGSRTALAGAGTALRGSDAPLNMDVPGILLSGAGFFCLTLALIQGNAWGWTSAAIVGLFVAAFVLLAVWVALELRSRDPMLDMRRFRSRQFSSAMLATLLVAASLMGAIFLLVIYMVNVLGYSEVKAAIAVTPLPLTGAVLAPLSGRLVDRFPPWILGTVGAACFSVGLFLMTTLPADAGWGDIAWRAVIIGIGSGLSIPALATTAMRYGGRDAAVQSSASVNWARQMGFVVGVAVLTAALTGSLQTQLTSAVDEARQKALADPDIPALGKVMLGSRLAGIETQIAAVAEGGRPPSIPSASQVAGDVPEEVAQAPWFKQAFATIRETLSAAAAKAFDWPFTVAALFSLVAIVPALLLDGRRRAAHAAAAADAASAAGTAAIDAAEATAASATAADPAVHQRRRR